MDYKKKLLKIGIIIFAIWFGIAFIYDLVQTFMDSNGSTITLVKILKTSAWCFVGSVPFPIYLLIIFSPAIATLYLLFRKFTNPKIRIILTAVLIPFLNMIYFYIEHFVFKPITMDFISQAIGAVSLFCVLPIAFLITLFLPKSLLPIKKDVLISEILMWVFGLILMIFTLRSAAFIDKKLDMHAVNRYNSLIESIEEYKIQNKIYPADINVNEVDKKFPVVEYTTFNNGNDYKLTISKDKNMSLIYSHCSSEEFEGCKVQRDSWYIYSKAGNWIKRVEND